jgi:hypothetical protein
MSGKPVAEQEIGFALLQEVVAYAENRPEGNFYPLFWGRI